MTDSRESEADFKDRLHAKLQNSGELEKLKQTLRDRLQECGWTDSMRKICKGLSLEILLFKTFNIDRVRASNIDDVSIDNLVDEVTPIGRDQVPADIKNEILLKLRAFLDEEA